MSKPARGAKKILVVDDEHDCRRVLADFLGHNAFEVLTAADGHEGLRQAMAHEPDLVVLDFNMPGMNGYELVQRLKETFETRAIPVIMLTGAPGGKRLGSMGLDLCDFIEKPYSNSRMLAAVRKGIGLPEEVEPPPPAQGSVIEEAPDLVAAVDKALEEEGEDLGADAELLQDSEEEKKQEEEDCSLDSLNDSPLISRVNKILVRAVQLNASDIHIEPQESEIVVRLRLNGSLHKLCTLPSALKARLVARVKIMANLIITERRRPQDGQFRSLIKGKKIEFRVSTLPSIRGEKIVLRVLAGGNVKSSLAELGLRQRDLDCVEYALQSPHGLILVTGPTGSGKTTTLYTMIRCVSKPDVNVLTAEDPVEYEMPGITQVHVKPAIGLTFENVLRSFLRQDPDVMLVGEIRDLETAEIAVKASITGHLVFSTLHTNTAPATITRLQHMGTAPFLVAASVKLVVAQRLVKLLCSRCKFSSPSLDAGRKVLSEAELDRLKETFQGAGCPACGQTGYMGRKPLFEIMPVRTAEMREAIINAGGADALQQLAVREGMATLRQAALDAVAAGETSLGEAIKLMLSD